MNENINLCEILKDCPQGTELYSSVLGSVKFKFIVQNITYPIRVIAEAGYLGGEIGFTEDGKFMHNYNSECTLFPSKDQRDWNKFKASWLKKPKFDPKTLQPFDKVLTRDDHDREWLAMLFSHIRNIDTEFKYRCIGNICNSFRYCIPYNDGTKHLVGTSKEAPEYYRYWE